MNKRHKMKIFVFAVWFLMFISLLPTSSYSYAFEKTTGDMEGKEIYVVYDTSGSMLKKNEISDCPWYETAYAMEFLVSMLGENDRAYVYFMQDVSGNEERGYYVKTYQMNDSNRDWRMEELHDDLRNIKYTSDTDVGGLMQAAEDLKQNQSDSEKFLVILSDGDFNVLNGQPFSSSEFDYMEEVAKSLHDTRAEIIYLALSERVINMPENQENVTVIRCERGEFGEEAKDNRIFEMFAELEQMIFGRYKLDYESSPGDNGYEKITFQADLPIKNLIILVQSEQSDVKAEEVKIIRGRMECASEGEISGPTVRDVKNQKNSYIHQIGEEVVEGSYKGTYSAWIGKNGSIKSGEYILEIPTDVHVDIYVKYEVDYRIIMRGEDGEEKDITMVDSVLEGEFELEVQLFDNQTGYSAQENAEIYKDLSVDLKIKNGDNVETMTGWEAKKFLWTKGTVYITGKIELDQMVLEKVKEEMQVTGVVRVNIAGLENGLDVDEIDHQRLYITVREGEEDISNCIENVSVDDSANNAGTKYCYECEKEDGRWFINPQMRMRPFIGEETIGIKVWIRKDGREQMISQKAEITYYASPKEFGFDINKDNPGKGCLFGVKIFPTFNGEKIYDPGKNEIIDITETLEVEETWKEYLELQCVNDNPLEYHLRLKSIDGIRKFWKKGSFQAAIHLEGKRYGQEIKGSEEIQRPVSQLERRGMVLTFLLLPLIPITILVRHVVRFY